MNDISFRMAGAGSWQNLLPDRSSQQLYASIYPEGISLSEVDSSHRPLLDDWERGKIIRSDGGKAVPTGPIITDSDLGVLDPWFRDVSDTMCAAVWDHLSEYRRLAERVAGENPDSEQVIENIQTIQICAQTLDSWVFSDLRKKTMGTYSPRGSAGTFFFWGYAFADGAKRIFGFTTYGGSTGLRLHVLRSHGLDREDLKAALRQYGTMDLLQRLLLAGSPGNLLRSGPPSYSTEEEVLLSSIRGVNIIGPGNPPRLVIPVFTREVVTAAVDLYERVTAGIVDRILARMADLKRLIGECSFSRCFWSDISCMLFHLAYSYAADTLVEKGTIPEFPLHAGGEWGVWI